MCRSGPHIRIGTTEVTILAGLREEAPQSAQWSSGGMAIGPLTLASRALPGADSVQGCCVAPREPRPNASPNQHLTPTSGSWLSPDRSVFFGAITRLGIRPAEPERRSTCQGGNR